MRYTIFETHRPVVEDKFNLQIIRIISKKLNTLKNITSPDWVICT